MNGWRTSKLFGLILILLLGSSLFPTTGWALSCAEPEPAKKAFDQADFVFKGIVMERKGDKYIIQVDTVYKGDLQPRTVVEDMIGDWLQETLKEGGTYLIYGQKKGFRIEVSPCGRTDNWAELKTDVEKFPNRELADYDANDFLKYTQSRDLKIASAIIGLLLLTGGWIFWRRRRNIK
jgi:LPXTG-motif cell wall-anchored protein